MLYCVMLPFEVAFATLAHKRIHDVATGLQRLHLSTLSPMPPPNEAIIDPAIDTSATQQSYPCLWLAKLSLMTSPAEAIIDIAAACY